MIFKKRFRNKRLPGINAALEMRRNQSFIQLYSGYVENDSKTPVKDPGKNFV